MHHIGIIVLDEAHHCEGEHPYAVLLKEFWSRPPMIYSDNRSTDKADSASPCRPKLLGLTASPVQVMCACQRRRGCLA